MYEVGGGFEALGKILPSFWVSRSSKRMPPGSRWESLSRSMRANKGKWFRHASAVSRMAFKEMIAMRADANVR